MSKNIQLTIADPCHENWDQMTTAEKGRFCTSCQKQVIDFTTMSDSQLAAFFKKPTTGSVCGRFYNDQLERDIEIPKKRIPWIKYFFQFALPAFLVSMKATAQGNVSVKTVSNARPLPDCSMLVGQAAPIDKKTLIGDTILAPVQKQEKLAALLQWKIEKPETVRRPATTEFMGFIGYRDSKVNISEEIKIKGKIVDEDNNPVSFATIMIKGTKNGIMADSIGIFKMEYLVLQKEIVLIISSVGYEPKEMPINRESDLAKEIVIQLTRQVMGEVVVVASSAGYRVGMVTGAVFKVTSTRQRALPEEKSLLPMIKVYPNPVVSGTNINVGCQKLKEGYYSIQLSNLAGQQVLNKQTWIDAEAQVLNIDIPIVAAGVYFLKLTNKETNKRLTAKVVIE